MNHDNLHLFCKAHKNKNVINCINTRYLYKKNAINTTLNKREIPTLFRFICVQSIEIQSTFKLNMANFTYLILALATICASSIRAAPVGPGASYDACAHTIPLHGKHTVQASPAPYTLKASQSEIASGGTVELTLRGVSEEDKFKGIVVLARTGDNDETTIGHFIVDESAGGDLTTMECGNNVSVST